MKNRMELIYVLISLSPAVGALFFYNQLPQTMATHFGMNNEVNGTMSKGIAILVLALLGLIPLLMRIKQSIDPKSADFTKFYTAFEVTRIGVTFLIALAGWAVVAFNLGYQLDIRKIVMIAVGLLFAVTGNYLTQVKPNYTLGIRTPWTLANEEVWRKTHRLGGPLMMIGGVIALLAAFFQGAISIILFLAAIAIMVLIPIIYSYVVYNRIKR